MQVYVKWRTSNEIFDKFCDNVVPVYDDNQLMVAFSSEDVIKYHTICKIFDSNIFLRVMYNTLSINQFVIFNAVK